MSYFSTWNKKINDNSDVGAYKTFVERYYKLEAQAYKKALEAYPETIVFSGTAKELAEFFGFGNDMVIFLGFLDGINTSLKKEIDLEMVVDETVLNIEPVYETLLYNMHDAGADWLFNLEEWSQVFDEAKRKDIAKQYRLDHTRVRETIGRNDPCTCGSGKKYKKCCGK